MPSISDPRAADAEATSTPLDSMGEHPWRLATRSSVKLSNGTVVIAETKGLMDADVAHKMQRLAQWIADLNALQTDVISW
jgi:hypothetical protein